MEDPRSFLRSLLNKNMKIQLSDGRVLVGMFLCTDKEANVILGCCAEHMSVESAAACESGSPSLEIEPRILGLAMVPGKHIVSIHVDNAGAAEAIKVPSNSPQSSLHENMFQ